jgi:lipopolysaccharide/colanic/teichoic acid biosynthesis glycosyltransferase
MCCSDLKREWQVLLFDYVSSFIRPCRRTETCCLDTCLENPPASRWIMSRTRRVIDLLFASSVLAILAIPMMVIGACVRLTSDGSAFFSHERVGRNGSRFKIYKFRSMVADSKINTGPGVTRANDERITTIGHFLRTLKLDELPQFYNVLRGDMSLVGPRPKSTRYAAISNMPCRPGITGAATIAFRSEEELLRDVDPGDLESFYSAHIKPTKARIDVCYMCQASPLSDCKVLASTLLCCILPRKVSRVSFVPKGELAPQCITSPTTD